jgi:hypothetical protein
LADVIEQIGPLYSSLLCRATGRTLPGWFVLSRISPRTIYLTTLTLMSSDQISRSYSSGRSAPRAVTLIGNSQLPADSILGTPIPASFYDNCDDVPQQESLNTKFALPPAGQPSAPGCFTLRPGPGGRLSIIPLHFPPGCKGDGGESLERSCTRTTIISRGEGADMGTKRVFATGKWQGSEHPPGKSRSWSMISEDLKPETWSLMKDYRGV